MHGKPGGNKASSLVGLVVLVGLAWGLLAGCGPSGGQSGAEVAGDLAALTPVALAGGEKLRVVATTNIVGDVVAHIGGDRIDLTVLMGLGVDPHSYVPAPADTAAAHDAHLVLANGAGLEATLEKWLVSTGGSAIYVEVSDGFDLLPASTHEGATAAAEDPDHGDVDPHVWFSVPAVIHWTERIETALSALDPGNADHYREKADAYRQELQTLDAWIQDQVAQVPEANRKLVTNHPVFSYFARRYGFEQLGAVYPFNPSAEPSARQVAALEDAIGQYDVPAIFAESTVNPRLARQVAADTGIRVVPLYTGSLGGPGSGAETYIDMMHYDVRAIVDALKGG
jgi:ABC-type Zn uptake system ZnuABC Zn-binding protein ZnuA